MLRLLGIALLAGGSACLCPRASGSGRSLVRHATTAVGYGGPPAGRLV